MIMVIDMLTMQRERRSAVWAALSRLFRAGTKNVKARSGAGGREKKKGSERSAPMHQPEVRIPYDFSGLRGSGGMR
jgi:hypothetical protein